MRTSSLFWSRWKMDLIILRIHKGTQLRLPTFVCFAFNILWTRVGIREAVAYLMRQPITSETKYLFTYLKTITSYTEIRSTASANAKKQRFVTKVSLYLASRAVNVIAIFRSWNWQNKETVRLMCLLNDTKNHYATIFCIYVNLRILFLIYLD